MWTIAAKGTKLILLPMQGRGIISSNPVIYGHEDTQKVCHEQDLSPLMTPSGCSGGQTGGYITVLAEKFWAAYSRIWAFIFR